MKYISIIVILALIFNFCFYSSVVYSQEKEAQLEKQEPIKRALIEKGGLLLKKGEIEIEPSLSYAHLSTNKISISGFTILPVLVIGEIRSQTIKRDIFINTLTGRYGLTNRLQGELKVPYRFQHDTITESDNTETTTSDNGVGDIEGAVYYQWLYEKGGSPFDVVLSCNAKSNTGQSPYNLEADKLAMGSGHWATKFSAITVKSSDPAILFGNFSYTWNIGRQVSGYGDLDPGDTIGYALGLALALNYRLAVTTQLEHNVTFKSELNDKQVSGSYTNVALLKFGTNWSYSDKNSVALTIGTGLTEDSPDLLVQVSFPFKF